MRKKKKDDAFDLKGIVPTDNRKAYLEISHAIERLCIDELPDLPLEGLKKIGEGLEILRSEGWLRNAEVFTLQSKIIIRCFASMKDILIAKTGNLTKKTKPKSHATDFLIYALAFDAKLYTDNFHLGEIAGFLSEKGMSSEVEKRFYRLRNEGHNNIMNRFLCLLYLIKPQFGEILRKYPDSRKGFLVLFKSLSNDEIQSISESVERGVKQLVESTFIVNPAL